LLHEASTAVYLKKQKISPASLSFSCLNLGVSGKRKKPKKFTAAKAVKSMARAALGSPPPVRRKESKRRPGKEKYRTTLGKLLSDSSSG
jgi:hypothetical protein